MKPPKNIYLITRAHGLRQHLLRSDDFIRMLRTKNLIEVSNILSQSEYSTGLNRIPEDELDAYSMEKIFYQKLSERLYSMLQVTSGKIGETLEDYDRKIEAEDLKRIIRAVHGKGKLTEEQLIPIPRRYQTANISALLEASTIREIIDLLKETPYRSLLLRVDLYEKYQNTLILEAEIDKAYYSLLLRRINKMPDKDELKELVGTEVDLTNLRYLLSFKHMNGEQVLLKEIMINVYYRLQKSLIPQLFDASYENIPRLLSWPPYSVLAEEAVGLLDKDMLIDAENIFLRCLYSYAETIALRNPINLAYVFAYVMLCLREARNLTTLVMGKQLGLGDEEILNSLFL